MSGSSLSGVAIIITSAHLAASATPDELQADIYKDDLANNMKNGAALLFAGGLKFIVLSAVLYAPGTALYFWSRREQGKKVFVRPVDWVIFLLACVGAIVGIYWIATGYIVL